MYLPLVMNNHDGSGGSSPPPEYPPPLKPSGPAYTAPPDAPEPGTVVAGSETRYAPYGGVRTGGPAVGGLTDFTYTGQQVDEATGLMFYNARWYDPALGRFVSADTIVPNPGNPQDLNRYAYVRNSPLNYTDPSGHYVFEEDPDDPWTYSDSTVRSRFYYTHPGYRPGKVSDAEILFAMTSPLWASAAAAIGVECIAAAPGAAEAVLKWAIGHPVEAIVARAVAEEAYEATASGTPFDPDMVALDLLTQFGDDMLPRRQYSQYSVAYEMELDPADYGSSRPTHNRRAGTALQADLESYAGFANAMEDLVPGVTEAAGAGATPAGWRWHHAGSPTDPRGVRMQLVPEPQHRTGSPWWDAMHPGGVGGWYHLRGYR